MQIICKGRLKDIMSKLNKYCPMSANKDLSYALYQVCQLFQSIHR